MELLQLTYFCDAAETQNFSETAGKFSVPPSNISQSIRRLEKELGTFLFDRSANRIILNEKGRAFYEKASEALLLLKDAAAEASPKEGVGELRLCINTNRRIVMEAVEHFQKAYPDASLITKFFGDPSKEEFDFIITVKDERLADWERKLLLTEPLALAIADSHPLAGKKVPLSAFASEPFITTGQNSNLYHITEEVCQKAGFSPRIAMQSDDPYYIRKCVELNLGAAIVPTISWKGQFSSHIRLIPLDGLVRSTYLYYSKKRRLSSLAQKFLDFLREAYEREKN